MTDFETTYNHYVLILINRNETESETYFEKRLFENDEKPWIEW